VTNNFFEISCSADSVDENWNKKARNKTIPVPVIARVFMSAHFPLEEIQRMKLPAPRGGASLAQPKTAVQALEQCHDDA